MIFCMLKSKQNKGDLYGKTVERDMNLLFAESLASDKIL